MQNFKTLRRVVDTFSTSVLNGKVDLHKMLGKVEDTKDTSELEMSAKKTSGLSPGANYPSVITLFRSPEVSGWIFVSTSREIVREPFPLLPSFIASIIFTNQAFAVRTLPTREPGVFLVNISNGHIFFGKGNTDLK